MSGRRDRFPSSNVSPRLVPLTDPPHGGAGLRTPRSAGWDGGCGRTRPVCCVPINQAHSGAIFNAGIEAPLTEAWRATLPGAVSFPLIADGVVVVSSPLDDEPYGMVIKAFNQATGAELWSHEWRDGWRSAGLAYDRGRVFVSSFLGQVTAYEIQSGTQVWTRTVHGTWAWSFHSLTAQGGVVYLTGAGDGTTLFAVREADGRVLWSSRSDIGGDAPALDDHAAYLGWGCGGAAALSLVDGAKTWSHPETGCSGGGGDDLAVADGVVWAHGGTLLLSTETGALVGTYPSKWRQPPRRWRAEPRTSRRAQSSRPCRARAPDRSRGCSPVMTG